jgi:hypothetical protein
MSISISLIVIFVFLMAKNKINHENTKLGKHENFHGLFGVHAAQAPALRVWTFVFS